MKAFTEKFRAAKAAYDAKKNRAPGLICKTGFYGNCPVLKLQKASWTNDDMGSVPNQTGLFFSIWLDDEAVQDRRIKYNIHALKLRQLTGYRITSIDFAREFRKRLQPLKADWPNLSVEFGPLTLMQGWIDLNDGSFDRDVQRLMARFTRISPIIDKMLKTRKK